ncbi:MAG TPA: low temperature requirement protein A [Kofleriaceae bacterium]|nr:low temperature requirement protein A [Kofleriaceae bacterium]
MTGGHEGGAVRRAWGRRMVARDPREHHRVATPLELLVDLCFVVAVAQVSARLHHGLISGHVGSSLLGYAMVFFAIWWAWMNFSWFASAYDTDDVPYRLTALVQIAGVLILAAGVPRGFEARDFGVITLGYGVMRAGLVTQWVRAAMSHPAQRRTALRYAVGVSACYAGWAALQVIPEAWRLGAWCVLVPSELLVPIWAERVGATSWHPHHIAERFGLFTLIVIGESVLSATLAIQTAVDAGSFGSPLLCVAGGGLLALFAMWWLYFERPPEGLESTGRRAFLWGYGHLLIFSSAAAVGAGLAVAADHAAGQVHMTDRSAAAAVAIPVAVYLMSVWALHIRPGGRVSIRRAACPLAALLALGTAAIGWSVLAIGVLLAGLVAVTVVSAPGRTPA